MKKIALMTWYENENYGTSLQAYALQQYLGKYGECKVIRYKTPYIPINCSVFIKHDTRRRYWGKLRDKLILTIDSSVRKHYLLNAKKYSEFVASNLVFTDLLTVNELCILNDEFDYFVCGSDQIWNPTRLDMQYFMGFVNENKTKIAYAPSFGVIDLNSFDKKTEIKEALKKFDYLSVREESGKKIIAAILGVEPAVCVDPTLLVSPSIWKNKCSNMVNNTKGYLLCYFLSPRKKYWDYVRKVSNDLNLEIKIIPYNITDYLNKNCIKEPLGTAEFLEYVAKASYICTDSFHGTIFSMIFGVPFIVMKRFSDSSIYSQNSRIYSLLQMTGQLFRLEPSENVIKDCYGIDLNAIECTLTPQRELSRRYLDSAFSKKES